MITHPIYEIWIKYHILPSAVNYSIPALPTSDAVTKKCSMEVSFPKFTMLQWDKIFEKHLWKINNFTENRTLSRGVLQGLCLIFRKTYFKEHL